MLHSIYYSTRCSVAAVCSWGENIYAVHQNKQNGGEQGQTAGWSSRHYEGTALMPCREAGGEGEYTSNVPVNFHDWITSSSSRVCWRLRAGNEINMTIGEQMQVQ